MNKFAELGLSTELVDVLDELGFVTPTPVQEQAIPLLLQEEATDFIGLAQTGTGKTAAFGLPLIQLVDDRIKATQALILAPTRELGQQTGKQLQEFAANMKRVNVEVVYGGAPIDRQIRALKKNTVQIIVATPGRLLDLIKRKVVRLQEVKYVVLDEADEMLNMGFKEDIDDILSNIEGEKVTWLFSATMPKEIRKIINKFMDHPKEVAVNTEQKTNTDITHQFVVTKASDKLDAVTRFLMLNPQMRGVMFCRTKRDTQQIAEELAERGYGVEALHGDLSQGQRDAVMKRFKAKDMQLLVATDVAARGIDVSDLSHVFHHTLPDQLESYTHRSGRTGRAGKKGLSLAFINNRESHKIRTLEKKTGVEFEKIEVPGAGKLKELRLQAWTDNLVKMEASDKYADELATVLSALEEVSKEDLVKKLLTKELDSLKIKEFSNQPLKNDKRSRNERSDDRPPRDRDRNRDRGDRDRSHERVSDRAARSSRDEEGAGSASNVSYNRYFVNLGRFDEVNSKELVRFLSEIGKVKKKHFGSIDVQEKCSYFELDSSEDAGFTTLFNGIEVEGRELRLNRDDEGGSPKGAKRGPKSGNRADRRSKKFGNDSGGYGRGGGRSDSGRRGGPRKRY